MKRFLQISLVISLLLLGLAKAYLLYCDKAFAKEEISLWFEPITAKYGLEIIYEINDDFFSSLENPPLPAGPGRNSKVVPIRHRVLKRYPAILSKAFEKYPDHTIRKYLKIIFFADNIDEDGLKYGGTYDPFRKALYLVDNGSLSDERSVYVFHHEFSSLLLSGNSFFLNPWTDKNPKGFKYMVEIYDNWKDRGASRENIKNHLEMGIVTNYGLTSFENDFNEYSAMILTYPAKFKTIMNQYPRVRAKFLVWLEFYQKIDPVFTEDYLFGSS